MLQFSSLQLLCVVVASYAIQDTLIFLTSLPLLCSSLIHHASEYASERVGRADRALCLVFASACVLRALSKPPPVAVACFVLGLYMLVVYFVARLHETSKLAHASIHTSASIVGTLLCLSQEGGSPLWGSKKAAAPSYWAP